ncbi:hypothetical protein Tco_0811190 [Tanacetum coccineum]
MMVREETGRGAQEEIMADEVIVLLEGQLVLIGEADQALTMVVPIMSTSIVNILPLCVRRSIPAGVIFCPRNIQWLPSRDYKKLTPNSRIPLALSASDYVVA